MEDERFYQQVADELREGRTREALWTKAIAQSMGDEHKTKALYIRMRVDQLMQEDARKGSPSGSKDDDSIEAETGSPSKAAKAAQIAVTIILIIVIVIAVKTLL
ncbi:MAG TPA: hypothetical protein VK968_13650, partial [Roseimicrobium sp.]|nr:hypothetical protein [Roseimicrobium sp.]